MAAEIAAFLKLWPVVIHLYEYNASRSERLGEWSKLLKVASLGVVAFGKRADREGVAKAMNDVGMAYVKMGIFSKAEEQFKEALKIEQDLDYHAGEAITLANLAALWEARGQIPKALEFVDRSLSISRESGNRRGEMFALANRAQIQRLLGQMQEAEQSYNDCLRIARELQDRITEGRLLNELAGTYKQQGKTLGAEIFYPKSQTIARDCGDRSGAAVDLHNAGLQHLLKSENADAERCFSECAAIAGRSGNRVLEGKALVKLALACTLRRDTSAALAYARRAVVATQSGEDQEELAFAQTLVTSLEKRLSAVPESQSENPSA